MKALEFPLQRYVYTLNKKKMYLNLLIISCCSLSELGKNYIPFVRSINSTICFKISDIINKIERTNDNLL